MPNITPEMIETYILAKDHADRALHGFHNLGRHFILEGTNEVWFMASDDYEVGHAAMMAELDRLRVSRALEAALSAQPVAVTPLAWNEYDREGDIDEWDASDGFSGYYNIRLGSHSFLLSYSDDDKKGDEFDDLLAAKAAAQADYEARILSALTPAPAASEPFAYHIKINGWGEELRFTKEGAQQIVDQLHASTKATITPLYSHPAPAPSVEDGRCPRPCNDRPADFSMRACIEAGECGCIAFPAPAVEGWRMVPEEPTREMWAAMADTLYGYKNRHHDKVVGDLWKAMLSVLPAAPTPQTEGGE